MASPDTERIDVILEGFKRTWIARYYTSDEQNRYIKCINCRDTFGIFLGIDYLQTHLRNCYHVNEF